MTRLTVALVALGLIANGAAAYEVETHSAVSAEAAERSIITSYLSEHLGISSTQKLDVGSRTYEGNDGSPAGWIQEGSVREDDKWPPLPPPQYLRPANHFYNPLTQSGYTGWWPPFPVVFGVPSVDWGLDSAGNDYSWSLARQHLYNGLTLENKSARERELALTFRCVGQVIHLVEDLAQPQHTRNDSHIAGSLYEKYTADHLVDTILNQLPSYGPVYPEENGTSFYGARDFWHSPTGKGLADYSNRGFVSAGTNFDALPQQQPLTEYAIFPHQGFPFPNGQDAVVWSAGIEDLWSTESGVPPPAGLTGEIDFVSTPVQDVYRPEQSERNDFTSTYSVFDPDLEKDGQPLTFTLNRYSFEAAWRLLIPRAVGYSAGLLNYFFRGAFSVHVTNAEMGQYAVRNDTAEPMNGTLGIYYDDAKGNRLHIADRQITLGPAGRPDNIQPFQFTAAASDTCIRGPYQGVFRGQLGLEADAVIPAAGAVSPAVAGPTVYVAGDLSGGGPSDPQGNLVWYSWYGACYQNGGFQCPIWLSWPWEGSYSGEYLNAPGWEGLFFFPCDYCCLGLGVTDSCNRSGYGEACHSLHSP